MSVRWLAALLLVGCTSAELNRIDPPVNEPPCDNQNPWQCTDGSCCNSSEPVCAGPDSVGFYCETQQYDPNDPTHMFGVAKKPRHYARKPGP